MCRGPVGREISGLGRSVGRRGVSCRSGQHFLSRVLALVGLRWFLGLRYSSEGELVWGVVVLLTSREGSRSLIQRIGDHDCGLLF